MFFRSLCVYFLFFTTESNSFAPEYMRSAGAAVCRGCVRIQRSHRFFASSRVRRPDEGRLWSSSAASNGSSNNNKNVHPSVDRTLNTATMTTDDSNKRYSDYEKWVRRLYATNMFHPVKMGLQNIQQLHDALGNPMDKCTVIHIAGTNGKGSVALKIARTLELARPECKVGLFCSPHVSSFRERMQCNSSLISEEEVVSMLPRIYELCQIHDIPATFFEITTALAFLFFKERQTEYVVLETGLGGRLDATNVVKQPAMAVITSIGLEHTRILGDTIELIALEKGGIIKEACPVLVGPNVPHDVLRKCAQEKKASQYYEYDDILGRGLVATDDYDIENARIAKAALTLLKDANSDLANALSNDDTILDRGISQRPPCRFEYVLTKNGTPCILDVAHNPPAMQYMVRKLQSTYPESTFRIVVGMSSDKDLTLSTASLLTAIGNDASKLHFVQAAHPRAATLEAILGAAQEYDLFGAHYDMNDRSITLQVNSAMELAKKHGELVVICGSVFLMAEAREALGFDEPRDSSCIAELAGAGVRHSQENFGNTTAPLD